MIQNFKQIFGSFSNRNDMSGVEPKPLTTEFKNRTLIYCSDAHRDTTFWEEMQKRLLYQLGGSLGVKMGDSPLDNLSRFLANCKDESFLDFLEYIFQIQQPIFPHKGDGSVWMVADQPREVYPENINLFFDQDELPYYLTDYVWVSVPNKPVPSRSVRARSKSGGISHTVTRLPQVICRDNEVMHKSVIKPVATLLEGRPEFQVADEEFVNALSDYRKHNFRGCVTGCCNALESVMKTICKKKGWENRPDSLAVDKLLTVIIANTGLNDSYRKSIQLVAAVRNTQGSAHADSTPRFVSRNVAQFVINLTGAAILLLVEESGL